MRAQDGPIPGGGGSTVSLLSISFLRKLFLAIPQRLGIEPFPGESKPEPSPESHG